MKKQYLWLLPVVIILIIVAFYLLSSEPSIIEIIQEQTEATEETTGVTPAERVSQNITEDEANATGGGSEGGKGGSSYTVEKVNYTLSTDSFPEGLRILINYSMNGEYNITEKYAPYSVEVESGTAACALLTSSVKGGTVIKWELDGEDCELVLCAGFMGCGIFMDSPHTAVVYYSTPG